MRFQLALNVRDLDRAVAYYSKLLGAPVNKRRPGYANFAVDSPPIKLVLFENPDATERLNHVGFEMMAADEVDAARIRLEGEGLADRVVQDETCCYAKKSTVYSEDPEGLLWEFYKYNGDADFLRPPTRDAVPAAVEATAEKSAECCPWDILSGL